MYQFKPYRLIPCLLLSDQGLVKTKKFKDPIYIGDAQNIVKIFNDKEVDELVILDIDASKEEKPPNFKLIKDIASEAFMPLAYGGGIRSVEDAKKLINSGVEKIIINTSAFSNPILIREMADQIGSQSVIVSIDVAKQFFSRRQTVRIKSSLKDTGLDPIKAAKNVQELGAGEILIHNIDNDGKMNGYDLDLIMSISQNTDLPIIACGGCSSIKNLRDAIKSGASAAAAGSIFVFHGPLKAILITFPPNNHKDLNV
tara:strand:+ start:2044 stop:2811 length:768 start_codon:yes stop_codon:yes gene_type:complete